MIVAKQISFFKILRWSSFHIALLLISSSFVVLLYNQGYLNVQLPWLPVSVIGTAVAFFVGFKNNQAYDRLWEARKIWGGIVNNSRTWGIQANHYVSSIFNGEQEGLETVSRRLVYRHIAWLYQHRSQLLKPTEWEHISQGGMMTKVADGFQRKYGLGLIEEIDNVDILDLLPEEEHDRIGKAKNVATQLLNAQAEDLKLLRQKLIIDDFRHVEMMETLQQFYELQGKNERIKKFPFPRQYASSSRYFVVIFLVLFPFSLIPEMLSLGDWGIWLASPITTLIGWIYLTMEMNADFTENPFQGMANDIPMMSLCRTIEIDLRQMLNESDLPAPILPKDKILM